MNIEFCAIASGSNGNCYYIGNEHDAILVDAGISAKQVFSRAELIKMDLSKVRAIFISHEHSDHMRGVRVLAKKLDVPVYFSRKTFENSWNPHRPGKYALFSPSESLTIGTLTIHTFSKQHDAAEPCSFRIEYMEKSVGVMTDIGSVCQNVIDHFTLCDAIFLESNFDEEMLQNGNYPYLLKRRVASDVGHLSNVQALNLVEQYRNDKLKILLLSHISQENNHPEIVYKTFDHLAPSLTIDVCSRTNISKRYIV